MSIQSELDRISGNIADTYAVLNDLGATMPSAQNSDNLAATAASIAVGAVVTESGTSGVYSYRKWSDGTKECWCTATATRAISGGSGISGLVLSTANIYGSYPSGLFSSPPSCKMELLGITASGTEYNGWFYTVSSGTAARTPQMKIARIGTAISSATVSFSVYAIGK